MQVMSWGSTYANCAIKTKEPIMSSRMNRKAPGTSKSKKGGAKPVRTESTPEAKPPTLNIQGVPDIKARDSPVPGHILAEASGLGSQNGFGSPALAHTPSNGIISTLDLDPTIEKYEVDDDLDPEYKIWKTMTKKARARAAVSEFIIQDDGEVRLIMIFRARGISSSVEPR